uniref:Major capsid protein N-terminal domain-containing protein n=1 Tax=Globodera rostochiensis TaxID=31243 RepID=A0A914GUR4_GLORO
MQAAPFHKIDRDSGNAVTSALAFFEIPDTDVSLSHSSTVEYLTLNPVNITPYHFKIHASSDYIDLSKCYVFTELRIRKEQGGVMKNLVAADDVSVCQMIGHTLWKNCRMSINGTQVFEGNDLMAYKSVMDYELTYPESVKASYLNVAGYYVDAEDFQLAGNGYNARRALFEESRTAQFIARLDVDPCNQPRYIVNQCEVDIELLPHSSQFVLLAPNAPTTPAEDVRQYHLEMISCKLYVKKAEHGIPCGRRR